MEFWGRYEWPYKWVTGDNFQVLLRLVLREGLLLCPNKTLLKISTKTDLPALKLTVCSQKLMVRTLRASLVGARPIFKGSASFNEGICTLWFCLMFPYLGDNWLVLKPPAC